MRSAQQWRYHNLLIRFDKLTMCSCFFVEFFFVVVKIERLLFCRRWWWWYNVVLQPLWNAFHGCLFFFSAVCFLTLGRVRAFFVYFVFFVSRCNFFFTVIHSEGRWTHYSDYNEKKPIFHRLLSLYTVSHRRRRHRMLSGTFRIQECMHKSDMLSIIRLASRKRMLFFFIFIQRISWMVQSEMCLVSI